MKSITTAMLADTSHAHNRSQSQLFDAYVERQHHQQQNQQRGKISLVRSPMMSKNGSNKNGSLSNLRTPRIHSHASSMQMLNSPYKLNHAQIGLIKLPAAAVKDLRPSAYLHTQADSGSSADFGQSEGGAVSTRQRAQPYRRMPIISNTLVSAASQPHIAAANPYNLNISSNSDDNRQRQSMRQLHLTPSVSKLKKLTSDVPETRFKKLRSEDITKSYLGSDEALQSQVIQAGNFKVVRKIKRVQTPLPNDKDTAPHQQQKYMIISGANEDKLVKRKNATPIGSQVVLQRKGPEKDGKAVRQQSFMFPQNGLSLGTKENGNSMYELNRRVSEGSIKSADYHYRSSLIQLQPLELIQSDDAVDADKREDIQQIPLPAVGVGRHRSNATNRWQLLQQQNQHITKSEMDPSKIAQHSSSEAAKVAKEESKECVKQKPNHHNIVENFGITQRQGSIPNHPKPNQDAFVCVKDLAGVEDLWLFGVCDGHGTNGHMVSGFVKKHFPKILERLIDEQFSPVLEKHHVPTLKSLNKEENDQSPKRDKSSSSILPPLSQKRGQSQSELEEDHSVSKTNEASKGEARLKLRQIKNQGFGKWFVNNTEGMRDQVLREAFIVTNEKLEEVTKFDSAMSGTTCVMLLAYKDTLICSNAGDSRAVLFSQLSSLSPECSGSPSDSSWKPTALSRDHKPDLADEATRIINQNGRIEQSKILPGVLKGHAKAMMHQLVGQHYGPKRVWLKHKQIPGLAMTRSIGDLVAKSVGVTAEPEIKWFGPLHEKDKAIVLGSDGLWDRLSNEDVATIIKEYYEKSEANAASQELTRLSVERWQKEHGMIDDITVIVIFLSHPSH